MRPSDACPRLHNLLAVVLLCLCCGLRSLCRECRWRFENCRRPHSAICSVVLRQWCPQTNGTARSDVCDVTQLRPTNNTREDDFDSARQLLSTSCNVTALDSLCPPHLCRVETQPCPWSTFREMSRSCAMIVKSRTRKPCCHPVTGDAMQCPCRSMNASCPFVNTFNSIIYTYNIKGCLKNGALNRYGRSRSVLGFYDIEIGLLGVVILLFLIFCSIIGVRRHWKLKQPMDGDCYLRRPTINRSNSAPNLAAVFLPMVYTNLGDPVPRTLLPMTHHVAP